MHTHTLIVALLGAFGIASIPAFLIFLDYHKRSNIHRAVLFVISLFTAGCMVAVLPASALLTLALFTPLLMMVYVLIARRR